MKVAQGPRAWERGAVNGTQLCSYCTRLKITPKSNCRCEDITKHFEVKYIVENKIPFIMIDVNVSSPKLCLRLSDKSQKTSMTAKQV